MTVATTATTAVNGVRTAATIVASSVRTNALYGRWQQSQRYNAGRYQSRAVINSVTGRTVSGCRPTTARTSTSSNYAAYGLRAPPRGYHYVRSGNDVVLAAIAGGLITAVIAGLFN
jgi:Ni/Co efflux regulator RcnB